VLDTKTLDGNQSQTITYLQQGADASCVSNLPSTSVTLPTLPSGFTRGLGARFYDITDANPDVVPLNRGWGSAIGSTTRITAINYNDGNLAKADACGLVVRGVYIAPGPETLSLYTVADDGIYVLFNNQPVINNWRIQAPTGNTSAPISIPAAGSYPFELRFYEWGGGATCQLYYRINDQAWKTDLTERFAYNPGEVSGLPSTFKPVQGRNVGTVQNNGDYRITMTITPRGTNGNWSNIVHLTNSGRDCCTPGDRMPAIWFYPNNSLRLHVRIGDTRDGNWGVDPNTILTVGTATNFVLECRGSSVSVQVGNETMTATQPNARPTGTATVLMSDSFYPAANCDITNFVYTPLN